MLTAFRNTPFREKTAWVMAAILIAGAAFYFHMVTSVSKSLGQTAPPIIGFVIAYVVVISIVSAIAMTGLALTSPREADAPTDEREKIITDRAAHWAGYALVVPLLGALWHYSVNLDGHMLFHLGFLSLMVGQISEYIFQIYLFRRGV
jgi:hypothetical protein